MVCREKPVEAATGLTLYAGFFSIPLVVLQQ
jgi:hypothetical protein